MWIAQGYIMEGARERNTEHETGLGMTWRSSGCGAKTGFRV